jgi:O-antigen ligase
MVIFYFLILVMPLSQHHIWAHFVGDLTGIKYLGMACLPYALVQLMRRQRPPSFFGTWQSRFFLLLYAIATLSHILMSRVDWWQSFWLTYTSMMILFFITLVVVDSLERLRWTIIVAIGSLGLASLYVLRDWQMFHNVYVDYRPGWVVGDPNYFSVSALLFLPSCFLLLQQKKPRWQWLFCLGCLVVTLTALMLSASRGGFLGLVVCSLYVILRSKHRLRRLIVIGVGFVLLTVFTPLSPWGRLTNPNKSDNEAVDTRLVLWTGGMRIVQAHPFLGVGINNFRFEVPKYIREDELPTNERVDRVAHNSYVEIVSEMGLPAIFAFLAMLISAWFSMEGVRRRAVRAGILFLPQIAFGLQAGMMGAAVAIFFVSAHYLKLFWLAIFLTMCLPPLCKEATEVAPSKKAQSTAEELPGGLPPLPRPVTSLSNRRGEMEKTQQLVPTIRTRPLTR